MDRVVGYALTGLFAVAWLGLGVALWGMFEFANDGLPMIGILIVCSALWLGLPLYAYTLHRLFKR